MTNQSLKDVFTQCQDAQNQHELVKRFYKIYKNVDKEEFLQDFLFLVRFPMAVYAREPCVEKTIDFISKAVTHVAIKESSKPSEDGEEEDDMHPLLLRFFTFLLDHHSATERAVRFRCCQLITRLLKDMGEGAKIEDDLYDRIYRCMVERLRDKCAQVRVHAALSLTRLQDPTDDTCPIVKAYMILMMKDPNMEVRRIVVMCIAPSTITLAAILERTRDVKEAVRRTAYSVIAEKVPFRALTIDQRVDLIQTGLNDRSEVVQTTCCEKLLQEWLRSCQGDILQLLQRLDVQTSVKTCEKALGQLFKSTPVIELVNLFDILDENQLVGEDKLSVESAFYWRTIVEYVSSQGHEYDEQLDRIRPNCVLFCSYVKKVAEQLRLCTDMDKMLDLEFIMEQLLQLLSMMDLSDTASRKATERLLHDLLVSENVGPSLVTHILPCLKLVQPDVKQLVLCVAETISEIREPITTVETQLTGEQRINVDKKIASIRVKVNELRQELSDCIENQDFERAAKLKNDISGLDAERSSLLEESQPQVEQVRTNKDDPLTVLKCLTIICELLVSVEVKKWSPELQGLVESQILTSVVSREAEIRSAAVRAIGLCCHIEKNMVMQHLPLLLQATHIDTPQVRASALKAILDIICIFGLDCFNEDKDQSVAPSAEDGGDNSVADVSAETSVVHDSFLEAKKSMVDEADKKGWTETASKVIAILSAFLDSEIVELRAIAAQGLSKLIMSGRVVSAKLLSHLLLLWFNPLTEEDATLTQFLGAFFPLFAFNSSENQQLVEEAFMTTLKMLSKAPATSPLSEVNDVNVACFLVELTNARHLLANVKSNASIQENPCHDSLAIKICNEILLNPDSFAVKLWLRTLNQLDISQNNITLYKDLMRLVEQMAGVVTEKQCIKLLTRFREVVTYMIETHETATSTDNAGEVATATEGEGDQEINGQQDAGEEGASQSKKVARKSVKIAAEANLDTTTAEGRRTRRLHSTSDDSVFATPKPKTSRQKDAVEEVTQDLGNLMSEDRPSKTPRTRGAAKTPKSTFDASAFATPRSKASKQKDAVDEMTQDLENLMSEHRASKTPHVPGTPKTPKRPLHSIQDPAFTGDV